MKKAIFQKGVFKMARQAIQRRAPRVRPEFEAYLQQSMNERPDLWQSLADSPTPMKSSVSTKE